MVDTEVGDRVAGACTVAAPVDEKAYYTGSC